MKREVGRNSWLLGKGICNGAPSLIKAQACLGGRKVWAWLWKPGRGMDRGGERLAPGPAGPRKLKRPPAEPGLTFLPPFCTPTLHCHFLPLSAPATGQQMVAEPIAGLGSLACRSPRPQAGEEGGLSRPRDRAVGKPSERGNHDLP